MSESAPLGPALPADETVLRLSFRSSDGRISPEAFELSSADKQQMPPRLSVFAASRTTPEQAWEITRRNPRFVAGHAALLGLAEGTKIERRILRVRLADLTNQNAITELGQQIILD